MIAFSLHEEYNANTVSNGRNGKIHIWGVEPVYGSYSDALKATLLTSFPHRQTVRAVQSICLLGPTLGFTASHNRIDKAYVYTVEWAEVSGESPTYPWRILDSVMHSVSGSYIPNASF